MGVTGRESSPPDLYLKSFGGVAGGGLFSFSSVTGRAAMDLEVWTLGRGSILDVDAILGGRSSAAVSLSGRAYLRA